MRKPLQGPSTARQPERGRDGNRETKLPGPIAIGRPQHLRAGPSRRPSWMQPRSRSQLPARWRHRRAPMHARQGCSSTAAAARKGHLQRGLLLAFWQNSSTSWHSPHLLHSQVPSYLRQGEGGRGRTGGPFACLASRCQLGRQRQRGRRRQGRWRSQPPGQCDPTHSTQAPAPARGWHSSCGSHATWVQWGQQGPSLSLTI